MMKNVLFINREKIFERQYKGNSHIEKIKIGKDVKNINNSKNNSTFSF